MLIQYRQLLGCLSWQVTVPRKTSSTPMLSSQKGLWVIPSSQTIAEVPCSPLALVHATALVGSKSTLPVRYVLLLTLHSLAYAEMRLILARMIWNFDMELSPDCKQWISQPSYVVWEKGNLNVKLTPVHDTLGSKG